MFMYKNIFIPFGNITIWISHADTASFFALKHTYTFEHETNATISTIRPFYAPPQLIDAIQVNNRNSS